MRFIGVTHRILGEGVTGAEIIPIWPDCQSPPQQRRLTKSGTLELTAQCLSRSTGLGSVSSNWHAWSSLFPGNSAGLSLWSGQRLFLLVYLCFLAALTVYVCLRREEPNVAGQFQGLLETIELFASCRKLSWRTEIFTSF